ncbi:MAG TPA: alpha/beta hydrolase [Verrucomicrobiae bacterium]|nr:alpha/beta hydrolase [Verrucomicrobiae bacterium]
MTAKGKVFQKWRRVFGGAGVVVLLLMFGCSSIERRFLFYPSHGSSLNGFTAWSHEGELIGVSRTVAAPRNVWLFLHGNAGQAADREYALPCFSDGDSVFIMEYPGYGKRRGRPGKDSFNAAAKEAYLLLRKTYPTAPVCVASESIGAGPACSLATAEPAPDKMVLVVPFEDMGLVARDHFPGWFVKLALSSDWNNVASLAGYKGQVDIFAAEGDTLIAPRHAQALAGSIANAKFTLVPGGHNDWAESELVKVRNP